VIAHVAGLPFEELLPAAALAGTAVMAARARLAMRLRRARPTAAQVRRSADAPVASSGALK
jgi:hypothetical protein